MGKPQLEMFPEENELFPTEPVVFHPDPARIRRRLANILRQARAAESMPWYSNTRRLYEKIVPQMVLALPELEAAQLRIEFEDELERLKI